MTLLDVAGGGSPLAGAAVYVWHCDIDGQYSMYGQGVAGENYLRGVQESDKDGKVAFTSIFPAAYSGRWPHIHFEVYESVDAAASAGAKLKTSQIALPAETCELVYATEGYELSADSLARPRSRPTWSSATATPASSPRASGSVADGIAIRLKVGV